MPHGDLVLKHAGKGRALPRGRRDPGVAFGQCQRGRGILQLQRDMAVHADGGKFRIEADVAIRLAVEEFAVNDQAGLREDRAKRQRLAPAGMRDDDIGNEAGRGQAGQRVQHLLGAMAFHIEAAGKWMGRRHIDIGQCVFDQPDVLDGAARFAPRSPPRVRRAAGRDDARAGRTGPENYCERTTRSF